MSDSTPRVYVGTYGKYNNGSIEGAWLTLEDYADKDAFLEACAELHKDESDPEFMFQDHECIPSGMIGESFVSDDLWDWLELDEDDRELLAVYQDNVDESADIDRARESFQGRWNSKLDWAYDYWESTGLLASIPDNLQCYIDYEAYVRDCECGDVHFVYHDGEYWAFNNY